MMPARASHPASFTLALLVALYACGGADTPAPTTTQSPASIRIVTTTTGLSLDGDGYTAWLGNRTVAVGVNGSAVFDHLDPGSYTIELSGLAANCSVSGNASASVTVAAAATAEVTFTVQCSLDLAGASFAAIACPGLAPASSSGMPLDTVALGSLPLELQAPIRARMSWSGGSDVAIGYVDSGVSPPTMLLPMHPGWTTDGGDVTVRITDETRSCPPFTFHIDPLPPAPGEYAAVADLAQQLVAAQAAYLGTTVDALKSTPVGQLAPSLYPLAVAQSLVDTPGNLNSMRAFGDGTATDLHGMDLTMVDRLTARMGVRADLEAALARLTEPAVRASGAAGAAVAERSISHAEDCLSAIQTAQDLSDCMMLARHRAASAATQDARDNAGFAMSVLAVFPNAVTKPVMEAVGLFFYFSQSYDGALAGLLPSSFASMTAVATPQPLAEDDATVGSWTATVTATSTGWEIEKSQFQSLVRGLDLETDFKAWTMAVGKEAAEAALGVALQGAGLDDVEQLFNELLSLIRTEAMLGVVQSAQDGEVYRIAPQTFGPVDVTTGDWTQSHLVSGDAVALLPPNQFEGRKAGTAQVEVSVVGDLFAGATIATQPPLAITVGQTGLTFFRDGQPVSEIFVTKGEMVTLMLGVENSVHPEMVELVEDPQHPLAGMAMLAGFNPGAAPPSHTVTYKAPNALSGLPEVLTARHTATTGARGYEMVERTGSLTINPRSIHIEPRPACLKPDDFPVHFAATVVGVPHTDVTWDASIGTIGADGTYPSPPGVAPGTQVTITATSVDVPTLKDSVTVTIGCACSYTLLVGGVQHVGQPGDMLEFASNPFGGDAITWLGIDEPHNGATFDSFLSDQPQGPGTFLAQSSGDLGVSGSDTRYYSGTEVDNAVVHANITKYTAASQLEVSLSGFVHLVGPAPDFPERIGPFVLDMQIIVPAGYSPQFSPFGEVYQCVIGP